MSQHSRILVVDDNPTSRLKMVAAASALGHDVEAVSGGAPALETLATGGVDLVLLDLVMPGMDGFEVLRRMSEDADMSDVPVLVITGVDDSAEIAEAIALGAVDVLNKNFDLVLLRARIDAALRRRRLRLAEADTIDQVHRLAAAAQIIEGTRFDPNRLGLSDLAARGGDFGRLARLFLGMADRIYRREEALRWRIVLMTGTLLLIVYGAAKGLHPTLSLILARTDIEPIGLAAGSLLAGAAIMACAVLLFGGVGRRPSRGRLAALACYAVVALAIPRVAILSAAETVPAQIIALLLSGQGLLVFALTAFLKVEARSLRRLLGLGLGIAGIALVLGTSGMAGGAALGAGPLALVMLAVLGDALGVVILSLREPGDGEGQIFQAGVAIGLAALIVSAFALLQGTFPPREALLGETGILVAALGAMGALATVAMLATVRITGPVFSSQSGCAATVGGVLWSVVLLDEPFGWPVAAALALLFAGLLLVMPRQRERSLDEALKGDTRLTAARERLGI